MVAMRLRMKRRKRVGLAAIAAASLLLTVVTVAATASLMSEKSPGLLAVYDTRDVVRLIKEEPRVLVFVEQHTCPSCAVLRPYVERLPEEVSGLVVVGYYVDTAYAVSRSDTLDFIRAYGVRVTPTLLLFVNGSLVGMHEGLFPGDQWEGLLMFVSAAASNAAEGGREEGEAVAGPTNPLLLLPTAAVLGAAAAFSPCSLPLMMSFGAVRAASGRRRSALVREVGKASVTVASSVLLAGVLLGWVGGAGLTVLGVPVVDAVAIFAAYFSILWGAAEFLGREVISGGLTAFSGLLPALGLQCSLPFFMAALTLSTGLFPALVTAAGFSLGFSLPYIAAAAGFAAVLSPAVRLLGGSGRLRGAVLVGVGAYLMYEVFVL